VKTETVALSKLRPYVRNPRVNDDVIEKLVDSLGSFGFRQPIVVDSKFTIVVGHARFEAAKRLGLKSAPVHIAKDLTAVQLKAYRLMDNRSREGGRWDPENLALELGDLEAEDEPLSSTGFDDAELREIFGTEMFVGQTDDDAVEAVAAPPASRSQPGDLFTMGPHRVVCGDCRVQDIVARLMKKKPADMCFTDPPYNVAYEGNVVGAPRKAIANDKLSDMGFRDLLRRAFSMLAGCMKAGGSIYVAHAETERLNVQRAFGGAGFKLSSCLIWKKDSFVLGRSDYHLEFPRPSRSEEHPTMKPVDLVAFLIRNSSAEGDIVVDAFGGSGSTLIAAHKEARVARLIELDPLYVDVIVRRWQSYTGESAKREGDGKLFDELPLVPVPA